MFSIKEDSIMNNRKVATAEQLFSFAQDHLEELELEEMGSVVYLRQLSAREVLQFTEVNAREDVTQAERNAAQNDMMAKALVDANGNRIIARGDEDRLSDLPLKLYMKIMNAITEGLAEISGADVIQARAEADLETSEMEARTGNVVS